MELRPVGRSTARLTVEDGRLVGYGAGGRALELASGRTLWLCRDFLAVLDRHGAGLITIEAAFCPYHARDFADRTGLGLWFGALSVTEPRLRLAGARRVRPAWWHPRRSTGNRVRRWAAAHGLVMSG